MKKLLLSILILLPLTAWSASTNNWPMEEFEGDLENLPSLQNGFQLYANYCLGCHSLQFQRYERTADDLGIPHDIALENLVFTGQKIGSLMTNAMPKEQSKGWFGASPPDLTLVTRVRSPEWVYNYLKTFYADADRPMGVNNKVYPNVGMPNVLLDLQGVQREICSDGHCDQLALDSGTGKMSAEEFDAAIYDLTNFLYYTGEPTRLERQRTGIYVLLFLIILGCFTYLLNREYWKDIDGH
ncbi:MAG: cytochrome c1 [Candidatus Azotimanducaceae bacterium]|jgi:cytochrome c1|tara:strand:+ start:2608 stop:3330 length:723 start_codon:yes stop_codon:yes gene_type:complete